MVEKKGDKITVVSGGSIVLGALIGIAFLIVIGALAGAVKTSFFAGHNPFPSNTIIGLLVVGGVLLLISAFFIAGLIAAKLAHQYNSFNSSIHSLGAWALMSILIMLLVSLTVAANSIRNLKAPMLVTDLRFGDPNAVTKLTTEHATKKTKEEKDGDKFIALLWWVVFSSLALGSGASVVGGKVALNDNKV
jgi:hypothetical protein